MSIFIISENLPLLHGYASSFSDAGHAVETAPDLFRARDRLGGTACDVVVIDVRSPDGGMGLLIEQAHAAWPDCNVVALVPPDGDPRLSKVHEMGLWRPDAVLVHPVPPENLVRSVAAIAGARTTSAGGGASR